MRCFDHDKFILGGAVSGLTLSLMNLPFEVVKVKMQLSVGAPLSTLAMARQVYRVSGFRGLYPLNALMANVMMMVVGNSLYYGFHEILQKNVLAQNNKLELYHRILIGGSKSEIRCFLPF